MLGEIVLRYMKADKRFCAAVALLPGVWTAAGCGPAQKTANLSTVYLVMAGFALLLFIGYCCTIRKKNRWMLLLFSSVLIVNVGYFALSVSKSLGEALLANRIAYLGSVFLPLSMLMIVLEALGGRYPKWLPAALIFVNLGMFFVAASPGYLSIYYQDVSIQIVDGFTLLQKVYGPWHKLYFLFLSGYFVGMLCIVVHAAFVKKASSGAHVLILAFAVIINIIVWLIEQLVQMDFEMLSVSYVITELFLLGLCRMLQEEPGEAIGESLVSVCMGTEKQPQHAFSAEQLQRFSEGLSELTPTEQLVYQLHLEGRSTREILEQLNIKENTLKYHNKNLYGKLGVSSRKQLKALAQAIGGK